MGDGAERDDDDNMMADDDRLGFLPSPIRRIFSMISDFASERSPFHIFGPSFHEHDQQPILIIGGSDGSGTRAFVDTIRELGAVIVADDRETFDVHAQMLFHHKGWPGLVHAVLNYTHTADYEWDDLIRLTSQEHVDKIETETKYLMKHLKMKYDLNKRPLRRAYLERLEAEGKYQPIKSLSQNRHKGKKVFSGVARPTTFPAIAKGISFAMKAPVSMLNLCLTFEIAPTTTFLFFVILYPSGRDVALSNNQSPVLKFYQSTYPDYQDREMRFSGSLWNVRAMQLWNDWNTAVYEWAMRHVAKQDGVVDYMMIRSEDLISRRLESLHALARFVDSTLTPEQLCALSTQKVRDYGKSLVHKELAPNEPKPPNPDIGEQWKLQHHEREKALRRHDKKHRKLNPQRRLQEVLGSPAKIDPSTFIRDVEAWKGMVDKVLNTPIEDTKKFVGDGLIGHGGELVKQWRLNDFDSQELENTITKQEIMALTRKLRVRLQEARLYQYKKDQKERPGDPDVKKRYGKWQSALSNNTDLSRLFYQEGEKGLEMFGYHPEKDIHYLSEEDLLSMEHCVDGAL
ncbi:MAG: hypothetical protein SGILL_009522, partial [Bacillariaceae sp.]